MINEKFNITGMTCAACSAHVEKAVREVAGVQSVSVNLLMNNMVAEFDNPATAQTICQAVEAAGYGAAPSPARRVKRREPVWRIMRHRNSAADSLRQSVCCCRLCMCLWGI